jgi:hypothetical protein
MDGERVERARHLCVGFDLQPFGSNKIEDFMAHFKLNELDDQFLDLPPGAILVAAGTSGAESWLERDKDATVRLVIAAVAVATADAAGLETVIEVSGSDARGEDGPAAADTHLQALQSVQLVVRPGERINFKAYPKAHNARVVRTLVYSADLR